MLLEAVAALPTDLNWSLNIVGDGVESVSLERLAERLGVRVAVSSKTALIAGFTRAIRDLAGNRMRREKLGRTARASIEREYACNVKSQRMLAHTKTCRVLIDVS